MAGEPIENETVINAIPVQERWLKVLGLRIFYRCAGSGHPPALLIHGGGSDFSGFAWKHTIGALAQQCRVIIPDLPGYGRSEAPSLNISDWRSRGDELAMAKPSVPGIGNCQLAIGNWQLAIKNSRINPFRFHIYFMEAFLDALGLEKASLVGISMGGGISLGFALANPQRVNKLVLVSSYGLGREMFGGRGAYLFPRLPFLYEIVRWSAQHSRKLVRLGMSKLVSSGAALTGEMLEDAWQSLRSSGVHRTWKAFLQSELTFTGYRTHFGAHLQQLSVPTLIVHGEKDRLIPLRLAEQAARQIPGARLHILKKCGHLPPRERPGEFNEVVGQFLKNPGRAAGGHEALGSRQ